MQGSGVGVRLGIGHRSSLWRAGRTGIGACRVGGGWGPGIAGFEHRRGGGARINGARFRLRRWRGVARVPNRFRMHWMISRWWMARPCPEPPMALAMEAGTGERGSRSHTMQQSSGRRIPRPIPWASLRAASALRSLARRRIAARVGRPRLVRNSRLASSRTSSDRKGILGMTRGSTSPGRLTPVQAAGGRSAASDSARNDARQLARRVPWHVRDRGSHAAGELVDEAVAGAKDEDAAGLCAPRRWRVRRRRGGPDGRRAARGRAGTVLERRGRQTKVHGSVAPGLDRGRPIPGR